MTFSRTITNHLLPVMSLLVVTSLPTVSVAQSGQSVIYSGIGFARIDTPFDNLRTAVNLNAILGVRVPGVDIVSAELEISTTIIPGDNRGAPSPSAVPPLLAEGDQTQGRNTRSGSDLQMNNVGLYLVARSPGRFYAMGRVGYGFANTNIPEIQDGNNRDVALGGGVGFRWDERNLAGLEAYFTRFNDDIDYAGIQISYGF